MFSLYSSLVGVANSDVAMATDHLTVDEPFTQVKLYTPNPATSVLILKNVVYLFLTTFVVCFLMYRVRVRGNCYKLFLKLLIV